MAFNWIKDLRAVFARASGKALTLEQEQQLFFRALRKNDVEALKKAAEKHPQEILSWTWHKGSPLNVAQRSGSLEAFKFLVEQGASVNEEYGQGWTPLILAVDRRQRDFLGYLLDKGVNLDAVAITEDHSGGGWPNPYDYGTALHIAARKDYRDIAVALLERGASTDKKTEIGAHDQTAVDVARWHCKDKMLKILNDAKPIRERYLARKAEQKEQAQRAVANVSTAQSVAVLSPLKLKKSPPAV